MGGERTVALDVTDAFHLVAYLAGVPPVRLHDYADICLMPTWGRSACSVVVSGLKMSA
jgi:hypothetical protein